MSDAVGLDHSGDGVLVNFVRALPMREDADVASHNDKESSDEFAALRRFGFARGMGAVGVEGYIDPR